MRTGVLLQVGNKARRIRFAHVDGIRKAVCLCDYFQLNNRAARQNRDHGQENGMYASVMKNSPQGKILAIGQDQHSDNVEYRDRTARISEAERVASIGRMACFISHDLRHPLSAIYANLEFLSCEDVLPSDRIELLHEMQEAVVVMTELIDSLLRFARGDGHNPLGYHHVGLAAERAVAAVRRHRAAHGVSIDVEILSLATAKINARRIESAIYNLLLNACQAAKPFNPEPKVTMVVEAIGPMICITVTDNGPGVPSSIRDTLFDPFVTCGKRDGLGLGLAIIREIAEEHLGSIQLKESAPGRTVFTLLIRTQA
jgi:signal transduction histidine kinase